MRWLVIRPSRSCIVKENWASFCSRAQRVFFDTPIYIVFLTLVVLVYWRLECRRQNILRLVASYVFYGWWDPRFLVLIAASTIVDFHCARAIASSDELGRRRALLSFLIAGPIQRPSHLLPQVQAPRRFDSERFFNGLLLILSGLFHKTVIADNCALLADAAFQAGSDHRMPQRLRSGRMPSPGRSMAISAGTATSRAEARSCSDFISW